MFVNSCLSSRENWAAAYSIARASYIRLNNYIDWKLSWLKVAFPTSRYWRISGRRPRRPPFREKARKLGDNLPRRCTINNLKTGLCRTRSLNNWRQTPNSAGIGCRRTNCHPHTYFQINEDQVQVRHVLIRQSRVIPPYLGDGIVTKSLRR